MRAHPERRRPAPRRRFAQRHRDPRHRASPALHVLRAGAPGGGLRRTSIPPEMPALRRHPAPGRGAVRRALPELADERLEAMLSQGMDGGVDRHHQRLPLTSPARCCGRRARAHPRWGDQPRRHPGQPVRPTTACAMRPPRPLPELWWRMHPADPAEDRGWWGNGAVSAGAGLTEGGAGPRKGSRLASLLQQSRRRGGA